MSKPQVKRRQQIRQARLEIVARLYCRGHSIRQICAAVKEEMHLRATPSTRTIHDDIALLLKEWREQRTAEIDAALSLELERIDQALQELNAAWERSKLNKQGPNVTYITELRGQLQERRKLLGLYAPEKRDFSQSITLERPPSEFTTEELAAQLRALGIEEGEEDRS